MKETFPRKSDNYMLSMSFGPIISLKSLLKSLKEADTLAELLNAEHSERQ
jgi:hypothetical protein